MTISQEQKDKLRYAARILRGVSRYSLADLIDAVLDALEAAEKERDAARDREAMLTEVIKEHGTMYQNIGWHLDECSAIYNTGLCRCDNVVKALAATADDTQTWAKERDRKAVQDFLEWACHTEVCDDYTWKVFSIVNLKQLIDRWRELDDIN